MYAFPKAAALFAIAIIAFSFIYFLFGGFLVCKSKEEKMQELKEKMMASKSPVLNPRIRALSIDNSVIRTKKALSLSP